MKRYLESYLKKDLNKKILLISGPRQSGKTTLSKMITESYDYLNFDNTDNRPDFIEKSWDRNKELIIFDEAHKMKKWKSWLKGIYDSEGIPPGLLVTGSARLDTYRKAGDSLAGRFFQFRLHPLDLKEINSIIKPSDMEKELEKMMNTGGFPEPYLEADLRFYNRWKKSHLDIIIKQDLIDLEKVQEISSIETLIQLLKKRVGSPVSYSSLARDLQCSDKTVKHWCTILENMYVIFKVIPYHKNIARSTLKSPKFYFYDTGQVTEDYSLRLENTVACALLKEIHFREDCFGESMQLYYLRNKEGREIDFLITNNDKPQIMIEVKWGDKSISPNFNTFSQYFPGVKKIQLVKELKREKTWPDGSEMRIAHKWLSGFSLSVL